jgi:hypothetical protein
VPKELDLVYHNNGSVMTGAVNLYHIYLGEFSATTMDLMDYFGAKIG